MKQIIFIFIIFLVGCKDQSIENTSLNVISSGTYSGRFIYQSSFASDTGMVRLTFGTSTFNCNPIEAKLLRGGAGNYSVSNSTIILLDTAVRVPLFLQGEFILIGEFMFLVNGNSLLLTQNNEAAGRSIHIELEKNLID